MIGIQWYWGQSRIGKIGDVVDYRDELIFPLLKCGKVFNPWGRTKGFFLFIKGGR